jgi:hypothetical protein
VFYLEKPIPIHKDETIWGSAALRKNDLVKTDVDVKFSYHYTGQAYSYDEISFYKLR